MEGLDWLERRSSGASGEGSVPSVCRVPWDVEEVIYETCEELFEEGIMLNISDFKPLRSIT
jgi:hypothetical protein